MISLSIVKESVIKNAKRFLKVEQYGVKTPDVVSSFGDDSSPLKDMIAIFAKTEVIGEDIVIGYINKNQISNPGEKRIFSLKPDGSLAVDLHLTGDGLVKISNGNDFAVKFSEMEKAFNELKADFNEVVSRYNSHVHSAPNGASPPLPLLEPTDVEMSAAKSDVLMIP